MKKSLFLASLVLGLAYAVVLITRFAGYTFSVLSIPSIIAGGFTCGLVLMAFGDYTRKPRFRDRNTSNATPQSPTPATSSYADATSAWAYTTFSA